MHYPPMLAPSLAPRTIYSKTLLSGVHVRVLPPYTTITQCIKIPLLWSSAVI